MSVSDFNMMTSDEMFIHLFAETNDNTMTRLALEILAGSKQSVTALKRHVGELSKVDKRLVALRRFCR